MKHEHHPINWHPFAGGTNVLDADKYLLSTKDGKPVEFSRTMSGGFVIKIDGQRYETDDNGQASAIMNKFEVGGVLKPVLRVSKYTCSCLPENLSPSGKFELCEYCRWLEENEAEVSS